MINLILVDTTVLIDIERGRSNLFNIFHTLKNERFCISQISLFELYVGLGYSKQKKGEKFFQKQKENLDKIINDFEVIPITDEIMKLGGQKQGLMISKGKSVDLEDVIIGTTGEIIQCSRLITRNKKHFEDFSISLLTYEI